MPSTRVDKGASSRHFLSAKQLWSNRERREELGRLIFRVTCTESSGRQQGPEI